MARSGLAGACAAALLLCFTLLSGCEGAKYSREVGATIKAAKTVGYKARTSMQECWNSCNGARRCKAAVFQDGRCWHKDKDRRTRRGASRSSVVLSRCRGKCHGTWASAPKRTTSVKTTSSSKSRKSRTRSRSTPAPKPTPARRPASNTGSRSNVALDTSAGSYCDNCWVHVPAFFKPGGLKMTCTNLGRGYKDWNCQQAAWQRFGDAAIYAQSGGDGNNCFICREGGSQDVSDVNVSGHDINRVWCKNRTYRAAYDKYRGGAEIGPHYCSHVGDGNVLKWTVDESKNTRKHVG